MDRDVPPKDISNLRPEREECRRSQVEGRNDPIELLYLIFSHQVVSYLGHGRDHYTPSLRPGDNLEY